MACSQNVWIASDQQPAEALPAALAEHAVPLDRRGVEHGWAVHADRPPVQLGEGATADLRERWAADRPLVLPGVLKGALAEHRGALESSLGVFMRTRFDETEFQDEVWERLGEHEVYVPAGASVDLGDEREVEKVFVDAKQNGSRVARDLWAKLSWISHDERDESMRIRFSFGAEALFEWREDPARSVWADRLAREVFPECAVLAENPPLVKLVEALTEQRVRFSERIIYSNSPDGGAIFHHDAEPEQLGVCYGQFVGATAWFALPKRELAELVAEAARGTPLEASAGTAAKALTELDREEAEELARLLNETPDFTRRLVEAGHGFVLEAGDALLMPNHGPEDTCWHSVFALGEQPSLSHSYGLFAALPE